MDLSKVLEQLRCELEHLDRAIRSLEQLHHSSLELRAETETQTPRRPRAKLRPVESRKVPNKAG